MYMYIQISNTSF